MRPISLISDNVSSSCLHLSGSFIRISNAAGRDVDVQPIKPSYPSTSTLGLSEPGHRSLRLPQHPQHRRDCMDMHLYPCARCVGLRSLECSAKGGESLSPGGATLWRHVCNNTWARAYSAVCSYGMASGEVVAQKNGAKMYEFFLSFP